MIKSSYLSAVFIASLFLGGCFHKSVVREPKSTWPSVYASLGDSTEQAIPDWKAFFTDTNLVSLIDTALVNNQELNIFNQELTIRENEIRIRKGEYLPFVNLGGLGLTDKPSTFSREGAMEDWLHQTSPQQVPVPYHTYVFNANASWEIDIWKKLRNAKQSAVMKYMAGQEGRHLLITNLVAEIAANYYELLSLDNMLKMIDQNIAIQSNAFMVITKQKEAGRATQLAVNRFEAQLLNTQSMRYLTMQRIVEAENRINFLTGRYPAPVPRYAGELSAYNPSNLNAGVPSQLLKNRPDIKQAAYDLMAAKLDVKVAMARFYPSLRLTATAGFQALNGQFLFQPLSILYNMAGELMSPLINRNAIKAMYSNANAAQLQSVIRFEQTILNAYIEVVNQLRNIDNCTNSLATITKEVDILNESVVIANSLFNSARADYTEVLLTQREALDAKIQFIEVKQKLLIARVNLFRALGGGWH